MYDLLLKMPNNIGQKILFDPDMSKWLNNETMVFAVNEYNLKGFNKVVAILS